MRFQRIPTLTRFAAVLVLAAGIAIVGGCASAPGVDPTTVGFKHYFLCPDAADVIIVGKRANAAECLETCKTVSKTMLNDTAKGCWWLDGSAGQPVDCRVCKTAPPTQDVFLNNWAMPLPADVK